MSAFPELICNTLDKSESTQGKVNKLLLEYFVQSELIRMNGSQPHSTQVLNDNQIDSNNISIFKS
jgi:hypothetical protein